MRIDLHRKDAPSNNHVAPVNLAVNQVATKSTPIPSVKKQVSLSWLVILLIVILPLGAVVWSVGWYLFYRTDTAYVTPEYVVIRADDDLDLKWVASEGEKVKKGQKIADVYYHGKAEQTETALLIHSLTREFPIVSANSAAISQMASIVSSYQTQLKQNKLHLDSLVKISSDGYVTPYEIRAAKDAYTSTDIALKKARADLAMASSVGKTYRPSSKTDFGGYKKTLFASIYSPIDGMIVKKLASTEEKLTKGQPILHIAGYDQFFIDMHMKSTQVSEIPLGSKCKVWFPDDQKVEAILTNYIQADSNGFVIGRLKPTEKFQQVYMIPGLPIKTHCR